jgi:dolichyl-phosphate beta-glucosyltransferase
MTRATIIVPCYNEADRLDTAAFEQWLARLSSVSVIFVNDGSRDITAAVLAALRVRRPDQVQVLDMPENRGKAEAVRAGLLLALAQHPQRVGYLDADLATPLHEIERLLEVSESSKVPVVLASRVALLGRQIERSPLRHYIGRVFATAASIILDLRVYDTQCGAKILLPTPALEAALAKPFISRWAFDVELIGRMLHPPHQVPALREQDIIEEPLSQWRDVPGSKLALGQMFHVALDLGKIARELMKARANAKSPGG